MGFCAIHGQYLENTLAGCPTCGGMVHIPPATFNVTPFDNPKDNYINHQILDKLDKIIALLQKKNYAEGW